MKIIIIGSANPTIFGLIADINQNSGNTYSVLGVLDNDYANLPKLVFGYPVLGPFQKILDYKRNEIVLINCIAGSMSVRQATTTYFLEMGYVFTTLVHPTVNLRETLVGTGTIIYQNAMIHPYVTIGEHCVVSSLSGIAHESIIEDFSFIGPSSYICGKVLVMRGAYLGVGCRILPRLTIGKNATVGACSMVNKNVPNDCRVQGTPAKVI